MDHSRRNFVRLGASAAALSTLSGFAPRAFAQRDLIASQPRDPWLGLKMGIATYSFSKLKLDQAIEGIKRVDLHYCSIKDAHLSLKSTPDERKAVAKKFRDAGITPLSCGNISPGNDESNIRNV